MLNFDFLEKGLGILRMIFQDKFFPSCILLTDQI